MNILNIQYNIFSVHAPGPMTFLFILEIFFFSNGSFHFTAPLRIRCRVFPYSSCFPTWRASLLIFPYQKRHESTSIPCSSVGEESTCNAGDAGSIPESRRSPREGNGNPLKYSCLGKSMDRRYWEATVRGTRKS